MEPKQSSGAFLWTSSKTVLQAALMLLGLTGLVDNVVVWTGFVADIVSVYQTVRDTIFSVLPFAVHDWIKDYLIVGTVFASSIRALPFDDEEGPMPFLSFAMLFWGAALLWPLLIVSLGFIVVVKGRHVNGDGQGSWSQDVSSARLIFRAFGWALVVFVGFLFVASDALSKLTGT